MLLVPSKNFARRITMPGLAGKHGNSAEENDDELMRIRNNKKRTQMTMMMS
jgi:hypothetical protein